MLSLTVSRRIRVCRCSGRGGLAFPDNRSRKACLPVCKLRRDLAIRNRGRDGSGFAQVKVEMS